MIPGPELIAPENVRNGVNYLNYELFLVHFLYLRP